MSALTIDTDVVRWSHPESERAGKPLLILLHGYGSNEADLFGLAPALPSGIVIASLRATSLAPFPVDGWSWFPITEPGNPSTAAVNASVAAVLAWLDALDFTPSSIGVGGFSQGGAMSIQLMRAAPERFSCALNLSGFAVGGDEPGDAVLAERKPPLFWGRGNADPVIGDRAIARTMDFVPDHFTLTGAVYDGLPHAISAEELVDISAFLDRVL